LNSENPEGVITSRDFVKYWATVERGRIEFGKGEAGQDPLVRLHDKAPVDNLKFVGFGSWHTPITIKNVKTMTPIVSETLLAKKYDPTKMITWYNNEILADCVVTSGTTSLFAHRAVLYCASLKLADFVTSEPFGFTPLGNLPIFKLPDDLRAGVFLQILKFVYTGRVVVDQIDPQELLRWAETFALVPLRTMCNLYFSSPSHYSQVELKLNLSRSASTSPNTSTDVTSSIRSSGGSRNLRVSSGQLSQATRTFTDFSRLLKNETFSDITFVLTEIDGSQSEIKAHRIIVAMQSEPFYLMFINPMRESTQRKVHVPEDADVFRFLLEYLYTGRLPAVAHLNLEDTIIPLVSFAHRYSIYPLRSMLCDVLIDRLDASNACLILSAANFFGLNSVRGEALEFIEQYFADVAKSTGFLRLDASSLMEIVFDDNLKVQSERDVYEALMRWGMEVDTVQEASSQSSSTVTDTMPPTPQIAPAQSSPPVTSEPASRSMQLTQLLSYVRYPLLSQDMLKQILSENNLIGEAPYLKKLVEDAISSGRRTGSGDGGETFRVTQRKSEHLKELFFSQNGDESGALFWIGTAARTQKFQNPHRTGKIKVTCSSPPSRFTRLDVLTGRSFVSCNQASGDARGPAWWAVDLGAAVRLQCNHYSLQSDGSGIKLTDWTLQASADGTSWEDLRVHENDTTSWRNGAIISWPVSERLLENGNPAAYRYFRVIVTGATSLLSHKLALCGLELYGYLDDSLQRSAAATL
jgi:hypothetical protein